MTCCIEAAVRSYKDVVPENDFCAVENNAVVVCVKIVADNDVIAVIAEEICFYPCVFASESEESVEETFFFLEVVIGRSVIFHAELFCVYAVGNEFAVVAVIKLACLLFFFFGHFILLTACCPLNRSFLPLKGCLFQRCN